MFHIAFRKAVVMALSFAVIVAFSVMLPGGSAAAKSKKLKMPTKMTMYIKEDGKWKKQSTITLKYNKNGDLIKYNLSSDDGPITIKYKYKKGRKVSATAKARYAKTSFKFNKKGQLTYVKSHGFEDNDTRTDSYKYSKKGYLTRDYWTNDNSEYYLHKGTHTYTTTTSGGRVSILKTGKGYYGDDFSKTMILDKKGLMVGSADDGGKSSYTYKNKGNLVTQRIEKMTNSYDGSVTEYRVDYSYGKRKAAASRYYKYLNRDERTVLGNL